jgi:hypothetical protein
MFVEISPAGQGQHSASKSWIISCIRADNLRAFRCGRSFNVLMSGSQKYHVHLNGLIHRGKTQPRGPMLSQGPSRGLAPLREGTATPSACRYEISPFRYIPCFCLQQTSVQAGQTEAVYSSIIGEDSIKSCFNVFAVSTRSVVMGSGRRYFQETEVP